MQEKEKTSTSHNEPPRPHMIWITGTTFLMGADTFYPEEAPAHPVSIDGFWMDQYTVTNEDFASFIKATGYITVAERTPQAQDYPGAPPETLIAGSLVFSQTSGPVDLRDYSNWWSYVPGANWRYPEGPGSSLAGRERHPVVHVAYEDAQAYAQWAGKKLPTEAQWELAARGRLEGTTYTWGNEFTPDGRYMANTWQGEFPWQNLQADGYAGTAPVGSFPPNGYGLYDMAGNVWEWTCDWYQDRHPARAERACCIPRNPQGASREQSYDPMQPFNLLPRKVLKGGSYLCAPNYCLRYRPAARIAATLDNATCHTGFRCLIN